LARIEAAPNFLVTLGQVKEFLIIQDADSAERRYVKLLSELREMTQILRWSPGSGRPARFFSMRSAQGRLRVQGVMELVRQTGLASLREYILNQYCVLYAHSDQEVVLLAVRHQRQLTYQATRPTGSV
jgi:hypothetical protein